MGGDGGVIASNRKYMRGAGTADHTADASRSKAETDPALQKEELARQMKTCAVSGQPLQLGTQPLVVCPYGRLYHKEAIVQALLERKQHEDGRIRHIRGLKDLHEVRFHLVDNKPVCPIMGLELNGQVAAFVLVPGPTDAPNVVSERAIKEMGSKALETEYGPIKDKVQLVPPASILQEIQATWQTKLDKKKSKNKKRSSPAVSTNKSTRAKVHADKKHKREQDDSVLSSIFTKSEDSAKVSEKEKKDNLFARC